MADELKENEKKKKASKQLIPAIPARNDVSTSRTDENGRKSK